MHLLSLVHSKILSKSSWAGPPTCLQDWTFQQDELFHQARAAENQQQFIRNMLGRWEQKEEHIIESCQSGGLDTQRTFRPNRYGQGPEKCADV